MELSPKPYVNMKQIPNPGLKAPCRPHAIAQAMENIHSETYSLLIEQYIKERGGLGPPAYTPVDERSMYLIIIGSTLRPKYSLLRYMDPKPTPKTLNPKP